MISIRRYRSEDALTWNEFVAKGKNATFLFDRGYMDYHADRFRDHSLLLLDDESVVALFVANEKGNAIVSHEGLTYGGLVLSDVVRLEDVLGYFFHVVRYYHQQGFQEITYKSFPSFLCRCTSEEDRYALFLLKARLFRCDTNCVFVSNQSIPYQHNRKRAIVKARKANLAIRRNNDPGAFWNDALIPNLQERFGLKPVHSLDEMKLLMSRFPDNIHMFEVIGDRLLGGALVYEFPHAVHTQYIAATASGKDGGALDLLFHELITNIYNKKSYLSFGVSTTDGGMNLNKGLTNWKEGFGARTMVNDFYLIDSSQYTALAGYE